MTRNPETPDTPSTGKPSGFMSTGTKFKPLYTLLFLLWASYLIAKGINVSGASQTRDAAEATYLVGGAIVAALALLPWRK